MRVEAVMAECSEVCSEYGDIYDEIALSYGIGKDVPGETIVDSIEYLRSHSRVTVKDERQVAIGEAAFAFSEPVCHLCRSLLRSNDMSSGGYKRGRGNFKDVNRALTKFLVKEGVMKEGFDRSKMYQRSIHDWVPTPLPRRWT